jgi:putative redox protein
MKIRNTSGLQFLAKVRDHEMVLDSTKKELGGYDAGIQPMELILVGLMGCTGMDVASIMRKMKVEFEDFSVEIPEVKRAASHPKVYTYIKLVYKVKGRNIDRSKVEKAVSLSQNKYCSASTMLKAAGVEIDHTIEISE